MYIERHAESSVGQLEKMFSCVMVTGPRQVGKTTMLQHIIPDGVRFVSMDDAIIRAGARENSNTFLKDNPPPVFIDEVQKAPELFDQIKLEVDKTQRKAEFYLSGSQQMRMMKGASESLSGRIGILKLLGLSLREINNISFAMQFVPTDDYYSERQKEIKPVSYDEIWQLIWRGSMPELLLNDDFDWQMYYAAYVNTYIDRDVRDLARVGDILKFTRFMEVMAANVGQMLNLSSIARDVGISQPTADRWLSVLLASNIIFLLKPYYTNLTKRAVKTPKLYFCDTGLAAYLSRWNNPTVLKNGAMAGAYFENFVIMEILKSYYNRGVLDPPVYYYRDKEQKEIDLLIREGDTLYPVEIKKHADPTVRDLKNFDVLDHLPDIKRGTGGVVCLYDHLITLSGNDRVIPVTYL